MSEIKVFVSYSWDIERQTEIVHNIEELCPERGIKLIRDNNTIKHGELISEFMDELTGSEHIITVFSKPYFESKWCMYELLEIWKKGDFKDRTHPIIADDCGLKNASYRMDVTDFWKGQYQTFKTDLDNRNSDSEGFIEERKKLKLLRDIWQNADEILNFAVDRLTTPLDDLKAEKYKQILDQIQAIKIVDPKCFDDDGFLDDVKKSLQQDLKKSDVFKQNISDTCTDILIKGSLESYLVQECVNGEFVQIIQNIQSAFVDTFDEVGEDQPAEIRKLLQASEGLVSKLVLFNVKNEWMREYRQSCSQATHHEHVLPKMTLGSVEVVMARESKTVPEFCLGVKDLSLQGGRSVALEQGFKSQNIVKDVIARLYKQVRNHDLSSQPDEERAIEILRKTIKQRGQQKNLKLRKNYFLVFPQASDSPLSNLGVQKEIKELLPELSFITLKSDTNQETFIVEDTELMVAINEFFVTLEEYKTNEQ